MKFVVYADAKQEFRWRLLANNNQIVATSGEGYKAKKDCEHGIELVKSAASAEVDDQTVK